LRRKTVSMRGWNLIDANVAAFVHHSWIGSVGTQQSGRRGSHNGHISIDMP
jgi:hypothetical protein